MNESIVHEIKTALRNKRNVDKAAFFPKFFKAGPGEYAEGDQFLGITNPDVRLVMKEYKDKLSLDILEILFQSPWHEDRLLAAFTLAEWFGKKKKPYEESILISFYLKQLQNDRINNWDLVDSTAYHVLGNWLSDKEDRKILYELAGADHLWSQRAAVVSSLAFIKKKDFNDAIRLCEILLSHPHDLIHKGCGWMLREIGNKSTPALLQFLDTYAAAMPRTMLRYAIEKLSPDLRLYYLDRKAKLLN
jgi:3-methyladenine DNA glycosylase AlkD